MSDIVVLQPIAETGITLLRDAGLDVYQARTTTLEELAEPLATARGAITRNFGFPATFIDAAPNLRVIGVHGTGTDRIDRPAANARGIAIVNTPGTNARSVAEHTLSLMLACARRLLPADAATRAGHFEHREQAGAVDLAGRTLGLVGFGEIGRRVAVLARALDMEVLVLSAHADPDALAGIGATRASGLEDLLTRSDVLSLHGVPGSIPVLDARLLGLLPRGAMVINTARGAMIDEAALAEALQSGQLGGAGLDAFQTEPLPADSFLIDCPNLVLTPHIGGSSREALQRTSAEAARKVLAALRTPTPVE
ncbi:MAG: hypothetical protein CML66_11140 [Rhodobacteraceae bacterium]|nr:hypothetical protein [Paracoccaceae bacterium]MAY46972.1 hypothetical protein [Paracoccaceae bacterium]